MTTSETLDTLSGDELSRDELSNHLRDIATKAALEVKDILVTASAQAATGEVLTAEKASIHDLVTKYDRQAEQIIAAYIFQAYPDSTFMGEEEGGKGNGAVHWYVDPIDGTSNFATGLPFFCVSIGVALEGEIIAGIIFDPIRNEMFSATTQGAFLNGQPIKARGNANENKAFMVTSFPNVHAGVSDADGLFFIEMSRRFATIRRIGSAALSLAYVACGRVDVAIETQINAWDVAAGMFILQQAGGRYLPFGSLTANVKAQPWLYPKFIATCPEFKLEESIINTFLE